MYTIGDDFRSKFICAPFFGGGGAEGPKTQKFFLFKPIDRESKVVQHVQKINFLSQLEGEI